MFLLFYVFYWIVKSACKAERWEIALISKYCHMKSFVIKHYENEIGLQAKKQLSNKIISKMFTTLFLYFLRVYVKFHLWCADIIESPKKIFVTKNIVFLCNTCIDSDQTSPKRKPSNVQSSSNTFGGGVSLQRSTISSLTWNELCELSKSHSDYF